MAEEPPRNARVRVVFIDQRGDGGGGAEESLALLIAHLPSDIEPHVILFDEGEFARRLRGTGTSVHTVRVPAAVAKARREGASPSAAILSASVIARLVALLKTLRPDVVYTNTIKAHVLGGIAARMLRIPVIAHHRDLLEGHARTLLRGVSATVGGDRVAITRAVADWYGLARTHVVDQPLDLAAFRNGGADGAVARVRLGLPASVAIAAIVGRVNRWKGHDRFLRAAAAVARRTPEVHFAIVGAPLFRDEDFAAGLPALAAQLGIAHLVTIVPWVPDVREVFAAIDINCNCSTREPFGRTIIEAAAVGVPSVCFADGGAPEAMIPGRTGIAVPPGDEAAFADAVLTYVDNPQRRRSDGEAARDFAERFDARRHGRRIAEIIYAGARRRPSATITPEQNGYR